MKDYSSFVVISYVINDLLISGFAIYYIFQFIKIKKALNEK